MERILVFDILSFWQAGSGSRAGALADATVVRDRRGLPYLPGKTVKGLVRDVVELGAEVGLVDAGRAVRWFGSPPYEGSWRDGDARERALEEGRFTTEPGALWFGSAELPEAWRRWASRSARSAEPVVAELFHSLASTAMDARGVARHRTLRVREVAVPMTLRARVIGPEDDHGWVEDLSACLPFLRALGSRRHRGFGRVVARMEEEA
jgi:hypothetical protein